MFLGKLVFKNSDISSSIFMGFVSSMMTLAAVVPLITQFSIFPYAMSLGWTRWDFIKGTIAFNILSLIFMELIINAIFIIGRVTSIIITMPGIGNAYSRILYFGFAVGVSSIFTFIGGVFYRYGFINGISSIFILLSPIMFLRHRIFDYIRWNRWGFEMFSLISIIVGVIFAMLAWLVVRKSEVRV
jgi:hypothetical protein